MSETTTTNTWTQGENALRNRNTPPPRGIPHFKILSGRAKVYDENGEQIATADSEGDAARIVTALRRVNSYDALREALRTCQAELITLIPRVTPNVAENLRLAAQKAKEALAAAGE
jgi:hypothetical protein